MNKINKENIALCIASINNKCLPVLLESIKQYIPIEIPIYLYAHDYINHKLKHKVLQKPNIYTTFGDAYNHVVNNAFINYDNVLICNDDIVFTPNTFTDLMMNLDIINNVGMLDSMGYLACRTDYSAGGQNIRNSNNTEFNGMHYNAEFVITLTDVIAPICALIHKSAWIDFKSINYFSDNIQCNEIIDKGYQHYIGTFYVHHVGSQSLQNQEIEVRKALDYLFIHDYNNYLKYKDVYGI